MKRIIVFTLLSGVAALSAALPVSAENEKQDDIVILYTNNVHSGIDNDVGYDGLALYQREMEAEHSHVILADAGDAIQGGHAANLSQGRNIVDLMNLVGYDVAVPGNHEFDYGVQVLAQRAAELDCGYISCNFMRTDTGKLIYEPYKIIDCGALKIGFVGVTPPQTFVGANPKFFMNEAGEFVYSFCEQKDLLYDVIQQSVDSVRAEGADYVILLAHLGEHSVEEQWSAISVAEATTGIDAVIDGHSHETTPALHVTNKDGADVVITQTGTKPANIGKMTISQDGIKTELIESVPAPDSSFGFGSDTWAEAEGRPGRYIDTAVNQKIRAINADLEETLAEECGTTDFELVYSDPQTGERVVRNRETNLSDFRADTIRSICQTEIGFLNGGSLRSGIRPGRITRGDILNVFPYDNKLVSARMTGQQILDGLELAVRNYPLESGAFLAVSGVEYTIDEGIESTVTLDEFSRFTGVSGEYRVKNVSVNGEPLDPDRIYTVATIDFLLTDGGDGFPFSGNCEIYDITDAQYSDLLCRTVSELPDGKVPEIYSNPDGFGRITVINSKAGGGTGNPAEAQNGSRTDTGSNTGKTGTAAAPKTGDAEHIPLLMILCCSALYMALLTRKQQKS